MLPTRSPSQLLAETTAVVMAVALPAIGVIFCGLWIVAVAIPVAKRLRKSDQDDDGNGGGAASAGQNPSVEMQSMAAYRADDASSQSGRSSDTASSGGGRPHGKKRAYGGDDADDATVYVPTHSPGTHTAAFDSRA